MTTIHINRRQMLRGLAALPLWAHGRRPAGGPALPRRLIMVWLDGGMSHLDTFDGKPEAGAHVRGDLRSVRGGIDGVFVSEHLQRLAPLLSRCVLLRSVTHGEGNHDRGSHLNLTGHRPSPVLVHPSLGSLLASDDGGELPAYVAVPDAPAYGGAGFLPQTCAPFAVLGDPGRPDFAVRDLRPADEAASLAALAELDRLDGVPRAPGEAARDRFLARALQMSHSPAVRAAFDLGAEPAAIRARYGGHRLGQSCLLARRLVQRGVRCVLVRDVGWDHHVNVARSLTYGFPPKLTALDEAVSALIGELEELDLGDDVIVCVASEFGRTPRLNPRGGRDHWPRAQSILLWGAGLRRGVVVGETDANGEEPIRDPIGPADVFATLWSALGEDSRAVLRTPDGRPVRVVAEGAAAIAAALA